MRAVALVTSILALAAGAALALACGETQGVILGETPIADAGASPTDARVDVCPCPSAVVLTGDADTALQGGPTATPFTDTCPEGQALVGFRGYLTSPSVGLILVGAVQAVCASLSLGGSSPKRLTTGAGATLPMRGTSQTSFWTQMCPSDQVVVGFAGRSGADLDQVAFECAPWTAPADVVGAPLARGAVVTLAPAGGDGGSPYIDGCPAGQLARGSTGQAGDWINQFGLVCGDPRVAVDAGP